MAIRLLGMTSKGKQVLQSSFLNGSSTVVLKGHIAVYVGETQKKHFIVPISYLNHPSFRGLLNQPVEEFGFHHPTGCITSPVMKKPLLISLKV